MQKPRQKQNKETACILSDRSHVDVKLDNQQQKTKQQRIFILQ